MSRIRTSSPTWQICCRLFVLTCIAFCVTVATAQTPVPFVDRLSPITAAPGGASFTLQVQGTGFVPGAVVQWTAGTATTSLSTTRVSGTRLSATVPASLITTTGTDYITVLNAAGVPASNPIAFDVTVPLGSLPLVATNITVGALSKLFGRPISVADFNHDGNLDLAVGNAGDQTVSILMGNGDGTFTAAPIVKVGEMPLGTTVGDFNNDGNTDLVVVDYDGTFYSLTGNGDGTFNQPATVPGLTCCPRWVASGDFNGDGRLDVAVALVVGQIEILPGMGDGTFLVPGKIIDVGQQVTAVAVGDLNNDGFLDLAATDDDDLLHILLGVPGGGFVSAPDVPSTYHAGYVSLGDVNNDGKLDMVVGNVYQSTFSLYPGKGDGTFAKRIKVFTGDPYATVIGNFDGDQWLDIASAAFFNNTASIYHGGANNSFVLGSTASTGHGPTFMATGDFNNDGALDFVTGQEYDDTITVVLQQRP